MLSEFLYHLVSHPFYIMHILVICKTGSAKKKDKKKEVKFAHNSCDLSPLVFVCIKLLYICVCLLFSLTGMDDDSVKLYKYMGDEVVGSEKVVNYRRQFFNVFDDVCNHRGDNEWHFISSGSKAEGLNLPESDIDVMLINKRIHVCERDDVLSINLVLDFNNAVAGFTLLRIYDVRKWNKTLIHIYENGSFLSNKTWKCVMKPSNEVINGPCFSDQLGITDRAYCLKYTKWPSKARQWIDMARFGGWPPESLINNIVQVGVLLVPIGSKSDSQKDNPFEWRISFSVPEKMLIYSWNHSQIICYVLLKLLLKEVIKKNENVDKLLCSYFLKTAIFWLSVELEQNVWTPRNLLHCFMLCLKPGPYRGGARGANAPPLLQKKITNKL